MTIISFRLNENLFLKDPQNSELGQNIIRSSISLIDEIGFEHFTFKKLADKIESTEASVYRYFENKHRLLVYLIDWYWTWMDYKMDFAMQNLLTPEDRLRAGLKVIIEEKKPDPNFAFVDEQALQRIVMSEFDKTYLTKQVDLDNKEGLFIPYKTVCNKLACEIKKVNPAYQHPHTLISTIMLSANHQVFYAKHLPSLTDINGEKQVTYQKLYEFCEAIIFNSIK
ncbi:TetR/AcrR family transcriptional regulator [Chryseotalea sanaruensis]|uniref:TetR/AcrR family transcriptional regulator n=1 Tax=Chryseotalea sanaruensis TaxID=2482724 RepID=A0A401UCE2_9BACT|nr:TetR/AcrR family transcriptional regulator [Chryseotalea sanaruensis]GCC52542.1 TetR/AcrR family transcriptional regulator [Chryseotalea sanaruensis]